MDGTLKSFEAFDVKLPLPRPLRLGGIYITHRSYVVVRSVDTEGNVGTAVGLTRNAPVAQTVLQSVAPLLEQVGLGDYADAYARVIRANVCLGTNGIFWRALSLVDCAVHDLMARRAGVPLYELLGGQRKATPRLLVGGYPSPEETLESLGEQIEEMARMTPAGIKIGSCGDFARDTLRLEAARRAMPNGPPLMIDLYWQCDDSRDLLPHAQDWAHFRMGWIEDPVAFDDFKGSCFLAENLPYPVAIGDEQSSQGQFERLMDEGGVRVLRLDATVCGGITAFRSIARAAAERGIPIACHVFPELHTHLGAAIDGVRFVETFFPSAGLDSLDLISSSVSSFSNGSLIPSSSPGSGFEWNEDALRHYRTEVSK